jgi:hypothetical protein
MWANDSNSVSNWSFIDNAQYTVHTTKMAGPWAGIGFRVTRRDVRVEGEGGVIFKYTRYFTALYQTHVVCITHWALYNL